MSAHPVLHLAEEAEEKLSSALRKFSPPFPPNDRESVLDSCRAFGDRLRALHLHADEIDRRRLKVLRTVYGTKDVLQFEFRLILEAPLPEAAKNRDKAGAASHLSKTEPRSGRKANADFNRKVAGVVEEFGPDWRSQLEAVSEALDRHNVSLPPSEKWKTKLTCSKWTDVFEEDPDGLVKALRHRLDWVQEHPPEKS